MAKSRLKQFSDAMAAVFTGAGEDVPEQKTLDPQATYFMWSSFDGEKNTGELGMIKKYLPDYHALSARAWQSYIENEVTHDVINKFVTWVIGQGLRLNADPEQDVLESEGINLSQDEEDQFSKVTESRYKVFTRSLHSSHAQKLSFQGLAKEAFKSVLLSGDILVIDRVNKNKTLTRQIVEGERVKNPIDPKFASQAKARGNRIMNGIEISPSNEHIAYFVSVGFGDSERVEAKNKRGFKVAYLVYGRTYRPEDQRGIPLVTAILETLKKMDRYKEATVGAAEERQKIPFVIEHGIGSTGENPFQLQAAKNLGVKKEDVEQAGSITEVKKVVSESYQKTVVNLPRDSKLSSVKSDGELSFEPFFKMLLRLVCATVEIPMEVALSWYDSNYSASRAALKDWEHTLKETRFYFSEQFYKPHYQHWLELEVLKNNIQAKGYLLARQQNNFMAVEAWTTATFKGANIPHIDPLKEVLAERAKLGRDDIPLTTAQDATEAVNGGVYSSNVNQFSRELKMAESILAQTSELNGKTIDAIVKALKEELEDGK